MNNFDFDLYANDGSNTQSSKTNEKKTKIRKNVNFDFDLYADEIERPEGKSTEESAREDKIYQQYATEEKSPEELKMMSTNERQQYAQELKREREYLQSAGTSKGFLSGLTLGATEHIEGLKPQEHELNTGFGELGGASAPIFASAKAISIPIKYALSGSTKYPKSLAAVSKLMTAFGTGSTYETGKQLVKNEGLSPKKIAQTGLEFATIDSLFRAGGKAFTWLADLSPNQRASILEKGIIPEDLPKSQYETAEKLLQELKNTKNKKFPGFPPDEPPGSGGGGSTILSERITTGKDIGLRPENHITNKNISDEVGGIFSKDKFFNTTEGGKALKQEITNLDEEVYRGVGEMYNISKGLNKEIEEIHPQLTNKLLDRLNELKKIPEPSDVQKRVIKSSENILNDLAVLDEGRISGYKKINNQTLIDQVQSLRQIIDYDFSHGNTKNIFRPLINDIQDSVISAAEHSGNDEAAQAFNDARAAYKTWVEAFDNDYVRPFRDISNKDYSKLFKSSLDFDESNVLRSILNLSEKGRELSDASTREVVEKHLGKFLDNPEKLKSKEFDKSLRELQAVITPEQAKEVETVINEQQKKLNFKAKNIPTEISLASKYAAKKPENIQEMMNSRSEIKELKKDSQGTESKKKLFETLKKQKIRSILREGNIEKEFTGDDLYKFLNKEKNYEILSEFLGEEVTESMRNEAKEIGKLQIRKEKLGKKVKNIAAYKSILYLSSLI